MSRRDIPPVSPPSHPYLLPLSIVLAGMMIAGAILYTQGPDRPASREHKASSAGPAPEAQRAEVGSEPRDLVVSVAGAPTQGSATARLVLIEFTDYQ